MGKDELLDCFSPYIKLCSFSCLLDFIPDLWPLVKPALSWEVNPQCLSAQQKSTCLLGEVFLPRGAMVRTGVAWRWRTALPCSGVQSAWGMGPLWWGRWAPTSGFLGTEPQGPTDLHLEKVYMQKLLSQNSDSGLISLIHLGNISKPPGPGKGIKSKEKHSLFPVLKSLFFCCLQILSVTQKKNVQVENEQTGWLRGCRVETLSVASFG